MESVPADFLLGLDLMMFETSSVHVRMPRALGGKRADNFVSCVRLVMSGEILSLKIIAGDC